MKPWTLLILLAVVVLALALLTRLGNGPDEVTEPVPDDVILLADAINRLALDLHGLRSAEPGNLICSPLNIELTLCLVHDGARGETAAELTRALHLPFTNGRLHAALRHLRERHLRCGFWSGCRLATANRLWGQSKHRFRPEFLATARTVHGAELVPLDFQGDPEEARRAIDAWLAEQMGDAGAGSLPPRAITAATRLVAAGTIHFHGTWAEPFEESATIRAGRFHLGDGRTARVPLMHRIGSCRYAASAGLQILELPYGGARLAMVILLPRERDGLRDLERRLEADSLRTWLDALHEERDVAITLPRFSLACRWELVAILKELGVKAAFSPGAADFSVLDGSRELFVSDALHRAFMGVDEAGTEAGASTVVGMSVEAVPVQTVFRADHPFLFLIRERPTGAWLFLGRLADPRIREG